MTTATANASDYDPALDTGFFGHPRGLMICFATEMWERFSFYGMKYLLLLYLTKYHLFSDINGLEVLGSYAALVYAMPVICGLLADRYLGMRKAVVFGGLLLVLGHLGMAVEGEQARLVNGAVVRDDAALQVFYLSLALIVIGVGFLKPNISTIVGRLYSQNDPRRDAGFTIYAPPGGTLRPAKATLEPGRFRWSTQGVPPGHWQVYGVASGSGNADGHR